MLIPNVFAVVAVVSTLVAGIPVPASEEVTLFHSESSPFQVDHQDLEKRIVFANGMKPWQGGIRESFRRIGSKLKALPASLRTPKPAPGTPVYNLGKPAANIKVFHKRAGGPGVPGKFSKVIDFFKTNKNPATFVQKNGKTVKLPGSPVKAANPNAPKMKPIMPLPGVLKRAGAGPGVAGTFSKIINFITPSKNPAVFVQHGGKTVKLPGAPVKAANPNAPQMKPIMPLPQIIH